MSYLAICLSTRHHFAGTCKNGTGKVGCGHQEEFRACSDVVITEEDGTADRTQNTDVDTWEEENEVDLAVNWDDEVEEETRRERGVERVVIILLASLLTVVFMFGSVFIYYYKAREHVKTFMEERDLNLPSLPALPKLKPSKRMRGLCKPLDKLGKLQWPLSNVSLPSSLPSFLHKAPVVPTISSPQPPPVPPPRTKRARSRTVSPTAGGKIELESKFSNILSRSPIGNNCATTTAPPAASSRSSCPAQESRPRDQRSHRGLSN